MKKIVMIIAFVLLAATVFAQTRSSGAFTTSQIVSGRSAKLSDLGVQTDGTAAVTVLLYDNATAASGNVLAFAHVPIGFKVGGWNCPTPVIAAAGIYAAVSGTGVTRIIVSFDPQ